MFTKYNFLLMALMITVFSCCTRKDKSEMVVYPEYCGGCISRNFSAIQNNDLNDKFKVYFDSTDLFILNESRRYNLDYYHIDNNEIQSKFGDHANIVIINLEGEVTELKTNETIEKGKHY